MDNKALNDALTDGAKEALGSLQFLVISLQAENAVLRAQVAQFEAVASQAKSSKPKPLSAEGIP